MKTAPRWIGLFTLLTLSAGRLPAQTSYAFDASQGTLEIKVYKEGFFKVFAHDHLVAAKEFSGSVQFDPANPQNSSVQLRVAAKSLTVVGPGEPEKDRSKVQSTMLGENVLDVARFPEIAFASTRVEKAEKQGDAWKVELFGTLRIHGVEKPVTFPLTVRASAGELTAQGEVFLLQTAYGITPVKIGGGAVKVKDRLRIHFEIHSRLAGKP